VHRFFSRRLIVVAGALGAILVLPAGAQAAFGTPITVAGTGADPFGYPADVGFDRSGETTVESVSGGAVVVYTRPPGAPFGASVQIGRGTKASLAVAANGAAVTVWRESATVVQVAYRPTSTAAFGPVATFPGTAVGNVAAGIDANGNAVVAWLDGGIHYALSTGATFGAAQDTPFGTGVTFDGRGSDHQRDHGPRVFRDNAGDVTLVYRSGTTATVDHRAPSGAWDNLVLPSGATSTDIQAEADPTSQRLIVGYTTNDAMFRAFEGSTAGLSGTVKVQQPTAQDIFSVAVQHGGNQDLALWRSTANDLISASCIDDFKQVTVGPGVGAGVLGLLTSNSDEVAYYPGGPGFERAVRQPGGKWTLTPFTVANFGTGGGGAGYNGEALGLFVDFPNDTGITGFPYTGAATKSATCASAGAVPPPVAFKSVDARVIRGTVLIQYPKSIGHGRSVRATAGFVPLKGAANIPFGSVLDTTNGWVALTAAANRLGQTQTAQFYLGIFEVKQQIAEAKTKKQGQAKAAKLSSELVVKGQSPSICPSASGRSVGLAGTAKAKVSRKHVLGQVFGNGHARVKTVGNHSSATVRGTIWLTRNRCDGTLTKVLRGTVSVRDFRTKKTISVKAGHSYLARAARFTVKAHKP
jgi:hypothetical protein